MKIRFSRHITKDKFYTPTCLYWLLRIFNLTCVYHKNNQLVISWSLTKNLLYVFVLGFINFFFLVSKINRLDGIGRNYKVTFSDTTQMTYLLGYMQYIIDLFCVYKFGRSDLIEVLKVYSYLDQTLGMSYYEKMRKITSRTTVFCLVFFILSSIFDYLCWIEGYGYIAPTLYSLDYFNFFLTMLTVLDDMSSIVQVEFRLKTMADLLQDYYFSSDYTIPSNGIIACRSENARTRTNSLKTLSHRRFIEVIGFGRCYLLLLEQTSYVNRMFGLRILSASTNLIINMISLTNVAIRAAIRSMVAPYGSSLLPSISSLARLLNWVLVVVTVVFRCEQNYREYERFLEIIDRLLINKNNSKELKTTLQDLRNLVITRPIKFHAMHFFTVDYTFLVSLTSVVLTYTIITLQNMQ